MTFLLMKSLPPFDNDDIVDISSFFGSIFCLTPMQTLIPTVFHSLVLLADVVSTFIQISINMLAQELAQLLVHSFKLRLFFSCWSPWMIQAFFFRVSINQHDTLQINPLQLHDLVQALVPTILHTLIQVQYYYQSKICSTACYKCRFFSHSQQSYMWYSNSKFKYCSFFPIKMLLLNISSVA